MYTTFISFMRTSYLLLTAKVEKSGPQVPENISKAFFKDFCLPWKYECHLHNLVIIFLHKSLCWDFIKKTSINVAERQAA